MARLGAVALALLCAGLAEGGVVNLTLYRVTPRNYSFPDNMNLGDASGDTYFAFIKLGVPAQCHNTSFGPCTPSTNIPGFNVFMQFYIEADERFGPYSQCNPDLVTGQYECDHWFGVDGCWYNNTRHPEWAEEFAHVCSVEDCVCPLLLHEVTGREVINQTSPWPSNPPHWPPQCDESMQSIGAVVFNASFTKLLERFETDEGGCCAACDKKWQFPNVPFNESCVLTTYFANTSTCELYTVRYPQQGNPPQPTPAPGVRTAYREPQLSPANKVARQSFTYMGRTMMPGAWYSLPSAGRCRKGDVMGRDCWWRQRGVGRIVNESCVDERISGSIVRRNESCFRACEDPKDKRSDCWIKCFFDIVVGNNGKPGITREEALEPFERAFLPEGDGGCPSVPDCPWPCLPPCWAVPEGQPCSNTSTLPSAGKDEAEVLI